LTNDTAPPTRYLFIVARNRPDILERVRERLHGDERIEVIVDRRYGERRRQDVPRQPDRRAADRRRPTKAWDDLALFPTLVAQKRVPSYAELERDVAAYAREREQLRAENDCLRAAVASLQERLEALISADAASKADAIVILTQAEDAVGSLIARLRALTS
jgi:cell division protein FtsB